MSKYMRANEVLQEDPPVWDIAEYMFEEADGGAVVSIYSKDMFRDEPMNNYFQLTCYRGTYDRILNLLDGAVKIELEEPALEGNKIYTQIQIYGENGDSDCVVVGQIRLPNNDTVMEGEEAISAFADFIKYIEKQSM